MVGCLRRGAEDVAADFTAVGAFDMDDVGVIFTAKEEVDDFGNYRRFRLVVVHNGWLFNWVGLFVDFFIFGANEALSRREFLKFTRFKYHRLIDILRKVLGIL